MNNTVIAALLACIATGTALYATLSESAVAATAAPAATEVFPASNVLDLSMPPPQAPFDMTPITPVETVGAAHFEPF